MSRGAIWGQVLERIGSALIRGKVMSPADAAVVAEARKALGGGAPKRLEPTPERPAEIFIDVLQPQPRLIVVGECTSRSRSSRSRRRSATARSWSTRGKKFGSAERFPDVDRIVSTWPDRALGEIGIDAATAVAVLTHDPKLDDPALAAALRSPAFYVGALGSRRTQEQRRQRLLEAGLDEKMLARLHAPIGLPIGGRSPGEIALSIMAQTSRRGTRQADIPLRASDRHHGVE